MAGTTATPDAAESSDTLPEETPPGPDGWPLVGNTLQFLRDPFEFFETLPEYGDVVRYSVAGQQFCTVLHPDEVERVLVTESESFGKWRFEEFGLEFASDGVLQTGGEQWQRQRIALQEAFTPGRIRSYADGTIDYGDRLVDSWNDGEPVALNRAFSRLTLRILARTLFDLDVSGHDDRVTSFARTLNERADSRNLSTFLPAWVPTPANRRYTRQLEDFRAFVENLIAERRAEGADGDDLLSVLVSADGERAMSDVEIRDQLVTFLFAGHDTTSLALTYTFLLLSTHPEVRRTLDAEHEAVLGGDPPTLTDLPDLTYTDQVITESLRLYPPAYVLFRKAREDAELGGYRIPEGTKLTLPQFFIHTDGRWYDDPESFRPERWAGREADRRRTEGPTSRSFAPGGRSRRRREASERASGEGRPARREEKLPEYAYFPFGGGPRHCIGMRFAMQELKLLVPTIAQRVSFDLLSDPDPDIRVSATMQPQEDVRATVHRR